MSDASLKRTKLAIVATHPIQYAAPVFRELARASSVQPKVFYTWSQTADGNFFDSEFGCKINWDLPLLDGYDYEFVPNLAARPGPHGFFGFHNPALTDAITQWSADAVLVYGWNNRSHLQTLRHFKGRIPVLLRGDSTLLDALTPLKKMARRTVLNWVYRHVDGAISVGQNSRDYFRWCGLSDDQIDFAPHCIENERFEDPSGEHMRQADQWREQLSIPRDDVVVVFAGKLIAKKDPLLLLGAFLRSDTRAHLVFFGSGELEAQLRSLAQGRPTVHFMPFQNQSLMPAVYRLADIFALPSCGPGETWGLALNEAMACKRPVLASMQAGATRDLVRDDVTGWSFAARDVDGLTELLRKTIASGKTTLQTCGENAYRAIAKWSVADSARGISNAVAKHHAIARP